MSSWIANYFLNPAYVLPGLALIAAPIVIHLINRMRYRRVKWAAMEFLLESQQRNKRRLLLEQLLLLLLRTAAVLAIIALIARPIIDPEQLSFFQGQKTHHLVLLDDSGSMRERWGETTAFAEGLDVIRKIAAEGARRPGTQTLTLVLLSATDQPVYTLQALTPAFAPELERKLDSLRCAHRQLSLPTGVQAAKTMLKSQPGTRNFHLISDFRRADWQDDDALAGTLRELERERIAVNLVKTVPESSRTGNLGLTELSGAVDVAAANVPLRLKVGVRNYGDQVAQDVRLTVLADGKKLPLSVAFNSLEAGVESFREFDVVFATSGAHDVHVLLPADALEQDNERWLAIDLAEANPVLVIDGNSDQTDGQYLVDALAPGPGITGFAPTLVGLDYLKRHPIDRFQSIFLVNVPELSPPSIRMLEEYVSHGGGLAWFVGDQVRPGQYNALLYKQGQGLFPAQLGSIIDFTQAARQPSTSGDEEPAAPDLVFVNHPLFRVLEGDDNPFVDSVKIDRYFSVDSAWTPASGVRVIASLSNKAPLFLEHRFGKGTVITCLTSCGTAWNNWPRNPSYVVLQLEMERYIARSDHAQDVRIVGQPISIVLDAAVYSPQVEVRLADGSTERLTAVLHPATGTEPTVPDAPPAPASSTSAVSAYRDDFKRTDEPGLYALIQKRLDGSEDIRRFSYNAPVSESRLDVAETKQIRDRLGPDMAAQVQEVGNFSWIHGEQAGQEIQDYVLLVLLLVLVGEQLLAWKLSYHPKAAGAGA